MIKIIFNVLWVAAIIYMIRQLDKERRETRETISQIRKILLDLTSTIKDITKKADDD
jgi:hypothetical protein